METGLYLHQICLMWASSQKLQERHRCPFCVFKLFFVVAASLLPPRAPDWICSVLHPFNFGGISPCPRSTSLLLAVHTHVQVRARIIFDLKQRFYFHIKTQSAALWSCDLREVRGEQYVCICSHTTTNTQTHTAVLAVSLCCDSLRNIFLYNIFS